MADGFISAFGLLLMAGGLVTLVEERSGLAIPFMLFGFMFLIWGLAERDEEVHHR